MKNEICKAIRKLYNEWNPSMCFVSGRYFDGAVREVTRTRLHEHGGFVATVETYADREHNINKRAYTGMYFPKFSPDGIAEWLSAFYRAHSDSVVGIYVTELRARIQPEDVSVSLEKMVERPWRYGYVFFEM